MKVIEPTEIPSLTKPSNPRIFSVMSSVVHMMIVSHFYSDRLGSGPVLEFLFRPKSDLLNDVLTVLFTTTISVITFKPSRLPTIGSFTGPSTIGSLKRSVLLGLF